ncbi:unnamed protein product [Oikopleura dioica]|uniref:Reverse transcriptase domain-containing protein n=1 Tax=Oikopleura dioica TaxID=34765 RepID=E4YA70_OIKDI|nr:unnamed protein product [Oikopleura dioica]
MEVKKPDGSMRNMDMMEMEVSCEIDQINRMQWLDKSQSPPNSDGHSLLDISADFLSAESEQEAFAHYGALENNQLPLNTIAEEASPHGERLVEKSTEFVSADSQNVSMNSLQKGSKINELPKEEQRMALKRKNEYDGEYILDSDGRVLDEVDIPPGTNDTLNFPFDFELDSIEGIEEEPIRRFDRRNSMLRTTARSFSTPKGTPLKRRRKSTLPKNSNQELPSPIRATSGRRIRRTVSSSECSVIADSLLSKTPIRSGSLDNIRPPRAAKNKARVRNEALMTQVFGESDSSMAESGTNSYLEDDGPTYVSLDEQDDFFKWKSDTDGVRGKFLFTHPEFMKRLKPTKFDKRTHEEFLADLAEIGKIMEEEFQNENKKGFIEKKVHIRTSYGRYSHVDQKHMPKLEKLINGPSESMTIREYVNLGGHQFIKNNFSDYCKEVAKARQERRRLYDWFTLKKGTRMEHAKDKYVSLLVAMARKGIWKLEQAISGNMEQAIQKARMTSPEKRSEIAEFQTQLKILAETMDNKEKLKELWLSNPSLIYNVIPRPSSQEMVNLMFDSILNTGAKSQKLESIGKARMLIWREAQKRGMILSFRSISRREIRSFLADKIQMEENADTGTPISVIQVSEWLKYLPRKYLQIIDSTIFNLILMNTKFEPHEINFENFEKIWRDKKGRKIISPILNFLNRGPTNMLKLIYKEVEIDHLTNKVLRTRSKESQSKSDLNEEEMIRKELDEGKIPKKRLPRDIPTPLRLINLELGCNSKNVKDFKAEMGRIMDEIQGNSKPTGGNGKNEIINPSNSDIAELMAKCNERNDLLKSKERTVTMISTNPGRIDTSSIRNILDHYPGIDILLVNELFASTEMLNDPATIPVDYKVFYNDSCPDGYIYSAILVRKDIADLVTQLENIGTITTIKLKLDKNRSCNISCVYRNIERSDATCFYERVYNTNYLIFAEWIEKCLNLAKVDNADTIICGDWNLDLLSPRACDKKLLVEKLNKLLKNHTNVIKFNTFFRKNCLASAIDYFFMQKAKGTKVKALNMNKEPLCHDGHTGHEIKCKLTGLSPEFEIKMSTKYNEDGMFRDSIKEAESLRILKIQDPNEYIEESFKCISRIVENNQYTIAKISPKVKLTKRSQPEDTKMYYAALNFIHRHIYDTENNSEFTFEEDERMMLTNLTKKIGVFLKKMQKRDNAYLCGVIENECKNPISAAWKITSELLVEPPVRILEENVEELMTEVQNLQKATTLDPNTYSKHTFKPKHKVKIKEFSVHVNQQKGDKTSILQEYNKLKGFTKGSTGISKNVLDKFHVSSFYDLVIKPIMLAVEKGLYPECWRTNRTIILPKKSGIRPISISELFAKILEKIIIGQITDFVENNGLLPSEQSGFRAKVSTGTSLAAVNLFACKAMDRNETVSLVAVDMRNAFGTPHHQNLVKCFANLFEGKALDIISSSLERWAIVNKDGAFSRREKMEEYGVPQGSVCSPTLFCLYISEIINILNQNDDNAKINIFADDTIISVKGKNFEEMKDRAEIMIRKLDAKLVDIGLQLVPEKTNILIFDNKNDQNDAEVTLGLKVADQTIEASKTLKYLGSTITNHKGKMSYELNNAQKINKMKIMVNRIRSIKNYVGKKAADTMHRAYSMGVINHNLDILPKWKAGNHNKAQRLYVKGLGATKNTNWFKCEKEFEKVKEEQRIALLTKSGHPTLFESQIKLYHAQLHKILRFRKNECLLVRNWGQ